MFAMTDRELRDLVGCRQWFVHGSSELACEQQVLLHHHA
jgi:hypothetical protein